MSVSTITSKGQVTIPKRVRDRLRLKTGDRLEFRVEEDGSIRVYPIAKKVSEVFGAFAEKASRPYSTEEIDERVRKAFRERRS
jgi:AbrB family looped-hinge helix DNA binding protein